VPGHKTPSAGGTFSFRNIALQVRGLQREASEILAFFFARYQPATLTMCLPEKNKGHPEVA